jgi:poly-gamma-glutamate synthesis protein (capsule biosynthesis protein)
VESSGFRIGSWAAGRDRPGLAIGRERAITADVRAARTRADLVVVLMHAGYEYVKEPNGMQRRLAAAALEAGATLVLGTHPHVLQERRRDGGRLVAYSLGNFVFDRMGGEAGRSLILDVTLGADGVRAVRTHPVHLVEGLPVLDGSAGDTAGTGTPRTSMPGVPR